MFHVINQFQWKPWLPLTAHRVAPEFMMKPLYECKEIKDREILNRSKESSKGKFTTHYLAYKESRRIGANNALIVDIIELVLNT